MNYPKNKQVFPTFLSVLNISHSDENIYEEIDINFLDRIKNSTQSNKKDSKNLKSVYTRNKTDSFIDNFTSTKKNQLKTGLDKTSQAKNSFLQFLSTVWANKTRRLIVIVTSIVIVLALILATILIVIGVASRLLA